MPKKDKLFILKSFVVWRIALFTVAFLSIYFLPKFGGRFPYVERVLEITRLPYWAWGFGNFDGVHYLRIAQDGYAAQFSQAFFPLFPLLIRALAFLIPKDVTLNAVIYTDPAYFYSGFILSNIFFSGALFVFYKLLRLDFKENIAKYSILLLIFFPTSFYFGSVYTESLFLLLSVSSIYLLRKGNYLGSSILITLATATRLIGILLITLYLIEVYRNKQWKWMWTILIMPLGLIAYMYYLNLNFGDPLYFLTSQPIFGAGRSASQIVLLPQVMYRYINILRTVPVVSLTFFNAFIEIMFTLIPLALFILYFKKMRFSYWIFSVSALILPTLTGTFSSMPRYALAAFLLLPYLVQDLKGKIKYVLVILGLLGLVLLTLFVRGYWVA